MYRGIVLLFAYVMIAFAGALPGQTNTAPGVINGTVAYRERVPLPLDAVIAVRLEEVSSPGAHARVVGESVFSPGQHGRPVAFQISYNPTAINPSHTYQLRAAITANGALVLTSPKAYRVITQGAPTSVAIVLQEVAPTTAASAAVAEEARWKFLTIAGDPVLEGKAQPRIVLHKDHTNFTCWTGCNEMFGTYLMTHDRLEFTPVGTSAVVCTDDITKHEKAVASAIEATRNYRTWGDKLELLLGDEVLATLQSENKK